MTNDARLIALDLETGRRCAGFGKDGEVRIEPGKPLIWLGEWQMTSAPTVYADLIIVGSSIGDNQRVDEPRGTVRAFDAQTAALRWDWDPIPRRADDPAAVTWGEGWRQAGAANVVRCRSMRRAIWCFCRRPARARISMADCGQATISMPTPWWR